MNSRLKIVNGFAFKRFSVHQERCAMKVGTDGVLLGAWASGGAKILDIGTGTGVVAMMMAQRYPESSVTAIDLDEKACQQATENVADSPFGDRIEVIWNSLQDFSLQKDSVKSPQPFFDAIVSNPPFFENSLKNPDSGRLMARHTDSLSYAELFKGVSALLSTEGEFSAIIPTDCLERFLSESYIQGFFLTRKCLVKTIERKQPKRCLVAFRKHPTVEVENTIVCLQQAGGEKSDWYRQLTKDFYL